MDVYAAELALEQDVPKARCIQDSLLLQHSPLLSLVFAQLSRDDLLNLQTVSRLFADVATRELLRDVELSSATAVALLMRRLEENPATGSKLFGFHAVRASAALLPRLSTLAPNLRSFTLTSDIHLTSDAIVQLLPSFPRLRELQIVGQDCRSRHRRFAEEEPEGEVGQALRAIADKVLSEQEDEWTISPHRLNLKSLSILSTPLKLSTIDYFLEVCGEGLESLTLEGCGTGPLALSLVEEWCPRIKHLRIDALHSRAAPPATPRPNAVSLKFDHCLPISLSTHLTSLHLSDLPSLSPSVFAPFSDPSHVALQSLSLSHCKITEIHLSHFSRITRLRLIACPDIKRIPIFTDQRELDVGPGCREVRVLSVLGCTGINLENLWELSMLGRENLTKYQKAERKRLGLGTRGLRKLTLDGAASRDHYFNISGFDFTLPSGIGSPSFLSPSTALPLELLPPTQLQEHLSTNVLAPTLPTFALLSTLVMAQSLEELSLFGQIGYPVITWNPYLPVRPPRTLYESALEYIQTVPILGPILVPTDPAPILPPVSPTGGQVKERGRIPTPKHKPARMRLGEGGKRLAEDDIRWLKMAGTGNLQRVSV